MGISRNAPAVATRPHTTPWTPPPGPSPLIRRDLFPAAVSPAPAATNSTPTGEPAPGAPPTDRPTDPHAPNHPKTRTILTTTDVYIFCDTPAGPELLFSAPLTQAEGDYRTGYNLTYTPTDPSYGPTTIQVRPTGACGCGSRLNSLRPWSQMRYTAAGR